MRTEGHQLKKSFHLFLNFLGTRLGSLKYGTKNWKNRTDAKEVPRHGSSSISKFSHADKIVFQTEVLGRTISKKSFLNGSSSRWKFLE